MLLLALMPLHPVINNKPAAAIAIRKFFQFNLTEERL
jgi:hypothetical protein